MRLVRFHLEPWQKGGSDFTVTPCASPLPLAVHRRQRSADVSTLAEVDDVGDVDDPDRAERRRKRKQAKVWRWRYPQVVKRLSTMCSDVIARNVGLNYLGGLNC